MDKAVSNGRTGPFIETVICCSVFGTVADKTGEVLPTMDTTMDTPCSGSLLTMPQKHTETIYFTVAMKKNGVSANQRTPGNRKNIFPPPVCLGVLN